MLLILFARKDFIKSFNKQLMEAFLHKEVYPCFTTVSVGVATVAASPAAVPAAAPAAALPAGPAAAASLIPHHNRFRFVVRKAGSRESHSYADSMLGQRRFQGTFLGSSAAGEVVVKVPSSDRPNFVDVDKNRTDHNAAEPYG